MTFSLTIQATTSHHFAGVNGMVNRPFSWRREDGQPSRLTKNYYKPLAPDAGA
ncbi:hypothetical protein phiA005_0045 [Aeromonas phage phiA005]|nr:hypothetical protein phiA005_0045 [Aeromonas phage phiA005]